MPRADSLARDAATRDASLLTPAVSPSPPPTTEEAAAPTTLASSPVRHSSGSRPLTIAYLASSGEAGGAERVILEMVSVLRNREPAWPVHVMTVAPGPLADRAAALGATVWVRPLPRALAGFGETATVGAGRPGVVGAGVVGAAVIGARVVRYAAAGWRLAASLWPLARYVRDLRALLRSTATDVVHSNGIKMHLIAAWARPRGAALVWHLHDYMQQRPLTTTLLRRFVGRVSAVIANSESVAAEARALMSATVVAIHNTVDLARYSPEGPALDLDAASGLPPAPSGVIRVGLVATFARWKGHKTFLRALAEGPCTIRGYIIGGPVYETEGSQYSVDELRALARDLAVLDRVGFTGFVADTAPALRALDIVVHASTRPEPFGLVVAEAMACGRPLIVSDAGGTKEIVESGVDALCTAPGDVAALARAIEVLASDPPRRVALGAHARQSAEQRFSRGRLAAQLTDVYAAARAR